MPLDPYSFVAPSRIKALLCPLGNIKKSSFLQYADRLSVLNVVNLADVKADSRKGRGMFFLMGNDMEQVLGSFNCLHSTVFSCG
jgi:hypothetical protein